MIKLDDVVKHRDSEPLYRADPSRVDKHKIEQHSEVPRAQIVSNKGYRKLCSANWPYLCE